MIKFNYIEYMGFKENLHNELSYQNMIVKELANKSGLSKHTIDNYLTGHNSIPKADVAVKIAKALNVSVEYLVNGEDYNIVYPPKIRQILNIIIKFNERDLQTILDLARSLETSY